MRKRVLCFFALIYFIIQLGQNYAQIANHVVIAEIYCDGGNSGAVYKYDYIVLYNPNVGFVDLSSWSVQYASAQSSSYSLTSLSGNINSEEYYLIRMYSPPAAEGSDLPVTENVNGSTNLSGTSGKIALVNDQNSITNISDVNVIDFIGYGGSPAPNEFEGSGKATYPTSTAKSLCRKDNNGNATYGMNGSGWDSDDNSMDFFSNSLPSPLPVELINFNIMVKNNSIILNWLTQFEINNYGFNVERGIISYDNNIIWETIGFVHGNGNSNSPKEYSLDDSTPLSGNNFYRLKQIDLNGTFKYSSILSVDFKSLEKFILYQNYPNPFNPTTKIKYSISERINVIIKLFDILGREVKILINKILEAGIYELEFDGTNVPAGIYLCKLQAGNFVQIKKIILIK